MEKFIDGIRKFRELHYEKNRELFARLSDAQSPRALFICCIDSRVDPNLITQSGPGELLTLRTVGNIVPPYDNAGRENGVGAALEMAVVKFGVRDIVVCGHTDCGAMQALRKSAEELKDFPHLRRWLRAARSVGDGAGGLPEERNVLVQIANLLTYPVVERAVREGRLGLHGWHYDIGRADVRVLDLSAGRF